MPKMRNRAARSRGFWDWIWSPFVGTPLECHEVRLNVRVDGVGDVISLIQALQEKLDKEDLRLCEECAARLTAAFRSCMTVESTTLKDGSEKGEKK